MGRVIALASGKGGVGKTFLTATVANALAQQGRRVLMIDAGRSVRSLDTLFGVDNRVLFDLGDAFSGRCRPSQAIQVVDDSLSLIPASLSGDQFHWKDMHRFFHLCAQDYDEVLVDCPSGASPDVIAYLRSADKIYTVVTPQRLCAQACETLSSSLSAYDTIEQGIIVNQYRPSCEHGEFSLDELIDRTKVPCLGVVPWDSRFAAVADEGNLPVKGAAVRACERIAFRIMGIQLPLPKSRKLFL